MFEGFEIKPVQAGDMILSVRIGGAGPPLLLLHGFPQTGAAWHRVAPTLALSYSTIIPDLPGYGASGTPALCPGDDPIRAASKRVWAGILAEMMTALGHERFHLAGHDRGARAAFRLALDHPDRVQGFISLDTVPTLEVWEEMDWRAALAAYHWPFLAQPAPVPETLIGADPSFYLHHLLSAWAGRPEALDPDAVAEYEAAIAKPEVIAAMCNDYRAGATVDVDHDREDLAAGRRLPSPMLLLRGQRYRKTPLAPSLTRWCDAVDERVFDCGHFIAEEAPEETAEAMLDYLAAR